MSAEKACAKLAQVTKLVSHDWEALFWQSFGLILACVHARPMRRLKLCSSIHSHLRLCVGPVVGTCARGPGNHASGASNRCHCCCCCSKCCVSATTVAMAFRTTQFMSLFHVAAKRKPHTDARCPQRLCQTDYQMHFINSSETTARYPHPHRSPTKARRRSMTLKNQRIHATHGAR